MQDALIQSDLHLTHFVIQLGSWGLGALLNGPTLAGFQGFELTTFQSLVQHLNNWATAALKSLVEESLKVTGEVAKRKLQKETSNRF